jgi:hypothetical protein
VTTPLWATLPLAPSRPGVLLFSLDFFDAVLPHGLASHVHDAWTAWCQEVWAGGRGWTAPGDNPSLGHFIAFVQGPTRSLLPPSPPQLSSGRYSRVLSCSHMMQVSGSKLVWGGATWIYDVVMVGARPGASDTMWGSLLRSPPLLPN